MNWRLLGEVDVVKRRVVPTRPMNLVVGGRQRRYVFLNLLNDEWSASEDVGKVERLDGTTDCISPNKFASHQVDAERYRPQKGG